MFTFGLSTSWRGDVELPLGEGRAGQPLPWRLVPAPPPATSIPDGWGPEPPAAPASEDGLFSPELNFPRLFDVTSCPSLLPRHRPPHSRA